MNETAGYNRVMDRAGSAAFGAIFLGLFLSLLPHATNPVYAFALAGTGSGMLAFFSRAIWPHWTLFGHKQRSEEQPAPAAHA